MTLRRTYDQKYSVLRWLRERICPFHAWRRVTDYRECLRCGRHEYYSRDWKTFDVATGWSEYHWVRWDGRRVKQ